MRIHMLPIVLAIAASAALTCFSIARADGERPVPGEMGGLLGVGEATPPDGAPSDDPLAPLYRMVGDWQGGGNSTFGPFTCDWNAWVVGRWITCNSAVYDANGQVIEQMVQLFGADPDGTLVCYTFSSSGVQRFTGTADAAGASFHSEDGDATSDMSWTVNDDGSMNSTYRSHDPSPQQGMPEDFWVDEIDKPMGG